MTAYAGIILAGGGSTRMGAPKASLDWHGSTLLRRAVGIVGRIADGPVVVVRSPGQQLPALPGDVEIAEDADAGRGPLEGLAAGLAAIGDRARAAFVCGTDAPLLHPALVRRVTLALDGEHDVAVPYAHGRRHPLAAAYRTALAPTVRELLDDGELAMMSLLERSRVRVLDEDELLADPSLAVFDPELDSLASLNERADYDAARARPAPEVTVRCFGAVRVGLDPLAICAASLGAAAGAAGVELGGGVVAMRNGEWLVDDVEEPLAAGDTVLFLAPERATA